MHESCRDAWAREIHGPICWECEFEMDMSAYKDRKMLQ